MPTWVDPSWEGRISISWRNPSRTALVVTSSLSSMSAFLSGQSVSTCSSTLAGKGELWSSRPSFGDYPSLPDGHCSRSRSPSYPWLVSNLRCLNLVLDLSGSSAETFSGSPCPAQRCMARDPASREGNLAYSVRNEISMVLSCSPGELCTLVHGFFSSV